MPLRKELNQAYAATFDEAPAGTAFASGRVNLIGDHVDYCDGLVLPMPIRSGTWVSWAARPAGPIEAVALDYPGEALVFTPGDGHKTEPGHWTSYVLGMIESCRARGMAIPGMRMMIVGNMPRGAGLSSSASLCIAVGRALCAAAGVQDDESLALARTLALAAQATEHGYAGVKCGIMDQMAIAFGEPGHALLLDCRDLATRNIAIPADWAVAIVQSGVTRGLVDGHYNDRRMSCERAAQQLGIASLRDATTGMIAGANLDPVTARRAQHVVEEIARTAEAATAIEQHDLRRLGTLLRASHASLRDLFEVSVPPVDALVDRLNAAIGDNGGARMSGGGFGGAVVAVVEKAALPGIAEQLASDGITLEVLS